MNKITILPGLDKDRQIECFDCIEISPGDRIAIVGGTGAGKSRFMKDIEQLVSRDSLTKRQILIDDAHISWEKRSELSLNLIAHLGQNMRFVLDATVQEFLMLHIQSRKAEYVCLASIMELANRLTSEMIREDDLLTGLSGGQSRALMIADIALVCDSPIVLIDEIENAGVDKEFALEALSGRGKIVFVVTHDPHTALLCNRRICLENGAIVSVRERSVQEEATLNALSKQYQIQRKFQNLLRKGALLV